MNSITIQLLGGLGNQLFCLAFGLAIARIHKRTLIVDNLSRFNNDAYGRQYLLDLFPHLELKCVDNKAPNRFEMLTDKLLFRFSSAMPLALRSRVYDRNATCFNERLVATRYFRSNITFCGYWQSYKYFSTYAEELRYLLQPPMPVDPNARMLAERIKASSSCAIHWRSYAEEKAGNGRIRPCQEYYKRALNVVRAADPRVRFYVFSDRPDLARHAIGGESQYDIDFVDLASAKTNHGGLVDFYLMYICNHSIIADSTFSWWASWLRVPFNSLVIAPGDVVPNADDWIPPEWITIPACTF